MINNYILVFATGALIGWLIGYAGCVSRLESSVDEVELWLARLMKAPAG